jgi:type 1 glutamine amidotransferase
VSRRALVVRGGWEGHSPVAATELFLPFLRDEGYEVRVEESTAVYADAEAMAETDLVVQSVTMSEIDYHECLGLRTAVEAGTGLVGWHGGIIDSFRADAEYLQLTGGQFATHPAKDPALRRGEQSDYFVPYRVEFTDLGRSHPITEGLDDFDLITEQYWVLHDDYNDVLATTTHPTRPWQPWQRPSVSPAAWTRDWGSGRVVVCVPGHDVDVLQIPAVRTIIERGMLWATRTT